jgi:hypothetical protein
VQSFRRRKPGGCRVSDVVSQAGPALHLLVRVAPARIGDLRVVADEASPRCPRVSAGRRVPHRLLEERPRVCRSWWAGTAECRADSTRAAPGGGESVLPPAPGRRLAADEEGGRRVVPAAHHRWQRSRNGRLLGTPPIPANRSRGLATAIARFSLAWSAYRRGDSLHRVRLGGRPGSCCLADIQEGAEMVMGSGKRATRRRSGRVCAASLAIHRGVI